MKFIYIYGEDLAALCFENSGISAKEVYDLVIKNNGHYIHQTDEIYFEAKIKEFGKIDPNFVKFVKNELIDYDLSKDYNIYIVED